MSAIQITALVVLGIHSLAGGFFKAVSDTLQFHYHRSVFNKKDMQDFWNPAISWRNKYKYGMKEYGPKFPGSTTWFVAFTDGWHLFEMLDTASWMISICSLYFIYLDWYWIFPVVIGYRLFRGGVFQLFYNKILIKK